MRTVLAAAAVLLAACGGSSLDGPDAAVDDLVDAAIVAIEVPRPPPGAARGTFELTYYFVTDERDVTGAPTQPVYDDRCEILAEVAPAFARKLRIAGTGRLRDGRVLNVDGTCGCPSSPCFAEVPATHPWGYGVQSRALDPYRSVAVDRKVVPIGTRLWLAELDGAVMPGDPPWGGFVHDGCVLAADVGGGIDGAQLDWFVGVAASHRALDVTLPDLAAVTVHDGGDRCRPSS